ncbi:MAG TPA: hypothetical protein VKU41_08475, partial [Polyangiaceae bacterium]|nr:hypothetical protein [Polyangiaceae bacterium]
HLSGCCPNFAPSSIDCTAADSCNGPALTVDQSQCILGSSCQTIQALGMCDRASSAAYDKPICPGSPLDAGTPAAMTAPLPGCWAAVDCAAGRVCCTDPTDFTFRGCAVTCGTQLAQLCQSSVECAAGFTCKLAPFRSDECPACQTTPALVGQCVLAMDAAEEAADDALGQDASAD